MATMSGGTPFNPVWVCEHVFLGAPLSPRCRTRSRECGDRELGVPPETPKSASSQSNVENLWGQLPATKRGTTSGPSQMAWMFCTALCSFVAPKGVSWPWPPVYSFSSPQAAVFLLSFLTARVVVYLFVRLGVFRSGKACCIPATSRRS